MILFLESSAFEEAPAAPAVKTERGGWKASDIVYESLRGVNRTPRLSSYRQVTPY
jgi:hypothetical protein